MNAKQQRPTRRLGLRQEANLFLPTSVLILSVLAMIGMFSYRGLLIAVTERAEQAVLTEAREAAGLLPPGLSSAARLRGVLDPRSNAAVLNPDGSTQFRIGDMPEGDLLAPLQTAPDEPVTRPPGTPTQNRAIAWLPLRSGEILRVDRPMAYLAAARARWQRLMIVVTLAVGALCSLLLLYMRRLFAPIDSLLESARALGPQDADPGADEIESLVRQFDRAMLALKEKAISEQRDAEVDGAPSAEQLRTLRQTFSQLESGMLLIDLEGNALGLNDIGARILEASPDAAEELPQPLELLLEEQQPLLQTLRSAIERQTPVRRQECSIETDSGTRTLGLTLSPLAHEDGRRRGWVALFADLTDVRARAQQELLTTSLEQLAVLSAGLAHELRNSLASLQGYTSLLRKTALPEPAAADAAELQRELGLLNRLVEDFLDFARPGEIKTEAVDLHRLAHRAAADPALGQATVRVEASNSSIEQTGHSVLGDEHMLQRLLRNLLLNAVRAQADQDESEPVLVRIEEGSAHEGPALHIEDRGPGLSAAAKKSLFVPFATHATGGTGLGLAVARRIADLHRARLTVDNRPDGGVAASLVFPPTQDDATIARGASTG